MFCWPETCSVGQKPALLAKNLFCWPETRSIGRKPVLLARNLFCWPETSCSNSRDFYYLEQSSIALWHSQRFLLFGVCIQFVADWITYGLYLTGMMMTRFLFDIFCYCGQRRFTVADWITMSYISLDSACREDCVRVPIVPDFGQKAVCRASVIIELGIFHLA